MFHLRPHTISRPRILWAFFLSLVVTAVLSTSPTEKSDAAGFVNTTMPTTTTTTLVPAYIVQMWEKVAWCETHGHWWINQPTFDGGLGISRVNWQHFAPDSFPDAPHLASKEQQVFVARKIQAWGGVPNYVPDQAGGCHAW